MSARLLLFDMASTVLFLCIYLTTRNLALAVGVGIALGAAQVGWEIARRKPVDTMQWASLAIVVASGTATLVTHDPRFMMIKLSVIYVLVGAAMCRPGWVDRYLPPIARETVPDIAAIFGFIWAGLMFVSAAVNVVVASTCSVATWGEIMSVYGTASKLGLFLIGFATMRWIGRRRVQSRQMAFATSLAPISGKATVTPAARASRSSAA